MILEFCIVSTVFILKTFWVFYQELFLLKDTNREDNISETPLSNALFHNSIIPTVGYVYLFNSILRRCFKQVVISGQFRSLQ